MDTGRALHELWPMWDRALESIVPVADRCKGHRPMLGRNSAVTRPDISASIYTVRSCLCTAFSKLYPHDSLLTDFINRMPLTTRSAIARFSVTYSGTCRISSDVRPTFGRKLLPHWQKKSHFETYSVGHRPVFGRSPEDVRTESVHVTEISRYRTSAGLCDWAIKVSHYVVPFERHFLGDWMNDKSKFHLNEIDFTNKY